MSNTDNMGADLNKEGTWFWNQSINKLESDSEYHWYSNSKKDLEPETEREGSNTEKKAPPQNRPREIK